MPEVDTIAGLANEGHYPIAKDVLIKIGILVLDDESHQRDLVSKLALPGLSTFLGIVLNSPNTIF